VRRGPSPVRRGLTFPGRSTLSKGVRCGSSSRRARLRGSTRQTRVSSPTARSCRRGDVPRRADPPRARGDGARCHGPQQCRDRRAARDQPCHRQDARQPGLVQAPGPRSRQVGRSRLRSRTRGGTQSHRTPGTVECSPPRQACTGCPRPDESGQIDARRMQPTAGTLGGCDTPASRTGDRGLRGRGRCDERSAGKAILHMKPRLHPLASALRPRLQPTTTFPGLAARGYAVQRSSACWQLSSSNSSSGSTSPSTCLTSTACQFLSCSTLAPSARRFEDSTLRCGDSQLVSGKKSSLSTSIAKRKRSSVPLTGL
jgi:hypothetical protein